MSALGALSVGSACSAGVLRFGIAPEVFRPYNENLAMFAGRVGIPLLGLGFRRNAPAVSSLLPSDDLVLFTLALGFALSLAWSNEGGGELYTTLMGVLCMTCILSSSWPADLPGVIGVLPSVVSVSCGADGKKSAGGKANADEEEMTRLGTSADIRASVAQSCSVKGEWRPE